MFDHKEQSNATKSVFMSSVHGIANTGAVVVTFFTVPVVYSRTVDWVSRFTAHHYGVDFVDLASFAWFVLVSFLIFFIARASMSTLLVMGGLAIAVRFL